MKALVTGAGGFVGQAVARQLLRNGHNVRSLSRKTYPVLQQLGVEQRQGHLADLTAVKEACSGCEIVFHVAAKTGIWGRYDEFYRANVIGTRNVIEACLGHSIPKLIFTSSPSVIFDGKDMEGADESVPYPDHYKAAYPETKARAERAVLAAAGTELATVSLRPHLVWGPGDNHLIPGLVSRARQGRLRQVGSEPKKVDFTYVVDVARAHLLAADRLEPWGRVSGRAYFITQGKPVYLWEFVNRVLAALEVPQVRARVPAGVAYAAGAVCELIYRYGKLKGEPPMTRFIAQELATAHWFDISAARRDLGYEPKTSLEDGIEELVSWWRKEESEDREEQRED